MNALPVVIEEVAISDEGTALQSKDDNEAKTQHVWESCCFRIDIGCASFITQTIVGVALLAFACYMIKTETNAERQYPYWGLIGTMCKKMCHGQIRETQSKNGENRVYKEARNR